MPIIDIEYVGDGTTSAALTDASALATAIGNALNTPAGRTWVRLRKLDASCYAENNSPVLPAKWPVFVTILHKHPPTGTALADEARGLTEAVASCFGCGSDRVHVQYAPPGAGRQAFGGTLIE